MSFITNKLFSLSKNSKKHEKDKIQDEDDLEDIL